MAARRATLKLYIPRATETECIRQRRGTTANYEEPKPNPTAPKLSSPPYILHSKALRTQNRQYHFPTPLSWGCHVKLKVNPPPLKPSLPYGFQERLIQFSVSRTKCNIRVNVMCQSTNFYLKDENGCVCNCIFNTQGGLW